MAKNESYEKLQAASSEDILEAAICFYSENPEAIIDIARWIRLGFRLAQADGWKEVATKWLDDYLESKGN